MFLRGIRGATTAANNNREEIVAATKELLLEIMASNQVETGEIASIIFTVSSDLDAEFPAVAARELGWAETPLLCAGEIEVPGSLRKCIRVLLHVNTTKKQNEIKHVYLKAAVNLRR